MPSSSGTQAERQMHGKFKNWSRNRRMQEAVRLATEEGWSQSDAARHCGVSRSNVNQNVKKRKEELAEKQLRSDVYRAERVAAFEAEMAERVEDPDDVPPETGGESLQVLESAGLTQVLMKGLEAPEGGLRETRRIQPPGLFMRTYFGNVVCPDCGVHHEIPAHHDEIISKICDPATRRLLINLAPYHAKSTVGTVYSTVYEICKDPNSRTAIVSKGQRLAGNFLYQIKKFLTDPNLYEGRASLIEDWGPFHNENNWSATEIYVAGRQSAEKDPTVSVYGVGAQIYGYRFDRMIFDDVADLENQRNPDRVAEMLQWATQECASRVGKTGLLAFIGTRVSPGDIYSYLQDLPAFETVRFPCILDEIEQTTLWPEHFPYKAAVEQRDSMSLEQFQLVYQNIGTPGFGAAFPLDVLEESRDTTRYMGHYDPSWRLVLGVDPAGAGEQAGYTAMVVLGIDIDSGRRYIVDTVNHKQMRAPQIKDQIIDFADKYPLTEIRVEVNGLQLQLFQYDVDLINKLTQRGIRFVPHVTHGRNKWDSQFGVESMGPTFYNKMISVPYGDINSRKKAGELHEQLAQFPMGQVSDLVMALWFADLGCRDLFQRFKLPAFDSRFHMPARLKRQRHIVDFGQGEVRRPTDSEIADPRAGAPKQRQLVNTSGSVAVWG